MPIHPSPRLTRGLPALTVVFALAVLHGCGSESGPPRTEPTVEQNVQQQKMLDFVKTKAKTKGGEKECRYGEGIEITPSSHANPYRTQPSSFGSRPVLSPRRSTGVPMRSSSER